MHKFKVGDRVRLTETRTVLKEGSVGEVLDDYGPVIRVCWDDLEYGHSCGGLCEYGRGWNVLEDYLVLAGEATEAPLKVIKNRFVRKA